MLGEDETPERKTVTKYSLKRRKLLQGIGAAGVGTSMSGLLIGSAAAEDNCGIDGNEQEEDEEDYESQWAYSSVHENEDYYYDHAIETRASLTYQGCTYASSVDRYYHHFRNGILCTTKRKHTNEDEYQYDHHENLRRTRLELTNREPERASLRTASNPRDNGASPPASDDTDSANYGSAAFTAIVGVMGVGSPKFAVMATAGQALGALVNHDEGDSGFTQEFEYPYSVSDMPCEGIVYCDYDLACFRGETMASIETKSVGEQYSGGGGAAQWLSTEVHAEFNCYDEDSSAHSATTADHSATTNSDSCRSGDQPEPGSPEYTDYLDQDPEHIKIPYNKIANQRLREIADGEPIYRVKNPTIINTEIKSESLEP